MFLRALKLGVLVIAISLAATASASAATYYIAPSGATSDPCTTVGTACTLDYLFYTHGVSSADTVIVLPGVHTHDPTATGQFWLNTGGATIQGEAGSRPTITQTAAYSAGGNKPIFITASGTVFENLRIVQQSASATVSAIDVNGGPVTIRDSDVVGRGNTVYFTGGSSGTSQIIRSTIRSTTSADALNVGNNHLLSISQSTIWSDGYGLDLIPDSTATSTAAVHNSIVHGGLSGARLITTGSAVAQATFDHSAIDLAGIVKSGTGTETVTDAGGNLSAPPVLADSAAGNFHQLIGSPTIDAGSSPFSGFDSDGDIYGQGCRPDIGADEAVTLCSVFVDPPTKLLPGVKLSIVAKRKKGKASLRIACPKTAVGSCKGTLVLKQGKKMKTTQVKAIKPGKTAKPKIKAKKGKAQITLTLRDSAGASGIAIAKKTLR